MKVLALDTALFGCSVALFDAHTNVCTSEQERMSRGQAELLVPMVQRVLEKAGAEFSEIDLIATTIGPGAFTGLRIGLSTAQGFALALDKPVAGVSTLDALAAQFFGTEALAAGQILGVLIETKRQDYYCQFFNADGTPRTQPQALSGEAVRAAADGQDVVYIGDALGRFAQDGDNVKEGYDLPDPQVIAALGLADYQAGRAKPPEPLYLRDADVSTPKKEQRVILQD